MKKTKSTIAIVLSAIMILLAFNFDCTYADSDPYVYDNHWKLLTLIYTDVNTPQCTDSFTEEEVNTIKDITSQLPDVFKRLSGGRFLLDRMDFETITEPITSISNSDGSLTYGPDGDIDFDKYLDGSDYDFVYVFAPLRNYPGITWYGLGGSFYTYNGRRIYYAISNQLITYIGEPEYEVDGEYYDTRLAVMVHEMLHCIETNSNSNGIHGFEAVHDAEQNGYDSGGTGEWFDWYHDLMQDTLKSGKKGFSEESFFIQHPQRILVNGVTISETSLEMESGGTAYLSASVTPENADYQNVVWNTSDPRIVRVSRDGKVTAYYPGKATVYASANNSMITAKCEVTVTGEYPNEIISVDQGYSKFTYNGKVKDPMLMIFNEEAWEDLLEDEQYTVSYSTDRKSIGRHTGTIRFIGKYKGFADRTISFTIVPAKGAFKSVTAGKKNLTIKIKAQKGGVKYKIGIKQKSAKKWKYYTISGTTKTIKNLKSKQQYQVKVQAFKKVDGETYKGSWSKPKTVRIK